MREKNLNLLWIGEVEVLDFASIVGLILAFALMIFGMATGDSGVAGLLSFWDISSVLITFGGTLGAVLAGTTIQGFVSGLKLSLIHI